MANNRLSDLGLDGDLTVGGNINSNGPMLPPVAVAPDFTLIQQTSAGGTTYQRWFSGPDGSVVLTHNAHWNSTFHVWHTDDITKPASKVAFPFDEGQSVVKVYRKSSGVVSWADGAWTSRVMLGSDNTGSGGIGLLDLNGADLASSTAPAVNTLYPASMLKAWANIHVTRSGSPSVALQDGFNITGVGLGGSGVVTVSFLQSLANSTYSVVATVTDGAFSNPYVGSPVSLATNGFSVGVFNTNSTLAGPPYLTTPTQFTATNFSSNNLYLMLAVFGRQ
jgi:hypothetical protein